MKRIQLNIFIGIAFLLIPVYAVYAQKNETISLAYCYEKAIAAYPALSDKELLKNASELRIKNINSNYLPQLSLNGQATYQSDVTHIALPAEMGISIPAADKDQYKVTLDAQQVIYDGGITRNQKKLEQVSSATDIQQIETDLLRVKEMVNNTYFTILLLRESNKLLHNVLQVISEKEGKVKSMVKNGVLLESDQNILMAERLKTEQQIAEIEINLASTVRILNLLTNKNFTDSSNFVSPELMVSDTLTKNRPEFKTFELQEKRFNVTTSLSQSSLMPKIYAFGQYGYGRPGINMLSNKFDTYYMVGATLKWNFWDWNKTHRDKQIYTIQKQMISTKRDNFTKNLTIDLQNRQATIQKLEEALHRDSDIVELRKGITQIAQSQLDNGVITSTDFLNELNAETQAKINLETHKIQLIQAKANYLLASGNI